MSDIEKVRGNFRKIIPQEGESLEELCKRLCDCELKSWYDNFTEQIQESCEYFIVNKELYHIYNKVGEEYYDSYCDIEPIGNNCYSFNTCFYNGGTYLIEILEEAIKELKE